MQAILKVQTERLLRCVQISGEEKRLGDHVDWRARRAQKNDVHAIVLLRQRSLRQARVCYEETGQQRCRADETAGARYARCRNIEDKLSFTLSHASLCLL